MQVFRYFHDLTDPFLSLTELDLETPQAYVRYIADHGLHCSRTYNERYFEKRLRSEALLREQFVAAGGRPERRHPYYLVLGNCDEWFYRYKGCVGALCLPLERLDPAAVSFTYGDSVPALDPAFAQGRPYHGRVYTMDTLPAVIGEYGWPQEWNPDGRHGYENYIEVQVWSEQPLARYRPAYADAPDRLREQYRLLAEGVTAAGEKITVPPDGWWDAFSLLDELKADRRWPLFRQAVRAADVSRFLPHPIHGLPHGIHCCLYLFAMGVQRKVSDDLLRVLLLAGLYHDAGRMADGEDDIHGAVTAEQIPGWFPDLVPWQRRALQYAVHTHCLRQPDIAVLPYGEVGEADRLTASLLRDADSLDYLRLGIPGYNTRFLTTPEAKKLIPFAMQINLLFLQRRELWHHFLELP